METQKINLTYESLIAILQGKDFHLCTIGHHFIFHPPFDGMFVTYRQLDEIRNNSQMRVLNFLDSLQKYEENYGEIKDEHKS